MRRTPFGGGRNSNMGGGSGGSVHMIRSIQRAFRAGAGDPISHSPLNNSSPATAASKGSRGRAKYGGCNKSKGGNSKVLSLSSSCTSPRKAPVSAASVAPAWPSCSSPTYSDESDWECVDEFENDSAVGFDQVVFGFVPSADEVQHAVASLQEALVPHSGYSIYDRHKSEFDMGLAYRISSPTGSLNGDSPSGEAVPDWKEPPLHLCNPSLLQPCPADRVYDVFHLLQRDPGVKRMVVSLSSDEAVWDAVLNNEVVRELRDASIQADNNSTEGSDEGSGDSEEKTDIIGWLVKEVKSKITELIQNITKMVHDLLNHPESKDEGAEHSDPFNEKLRAAWMLSVVVLLIVVLRRADKA